MAGCLVEALRAGETISATLAAWLKKASRRRGDRPHRRRLHHRHGRRVGSRPAYRPATDRQLASSLASYRPRILRVSRPNR
jgi:hypothetical protein